MPDISLTGTLQVSTLAPNFGAVDTNTITTSLVAPGIQTTQLIGNILQYWTSPVETITKDTVDLTIELLPFLNIANMATEVDLILSASTLIIDTASVDTNTIDTSLKTLDTKLIVDTSKYTSVPDLSNLTRLSTFVTSGADPVTTFTPTQSWYMG